MVAAAAAVASGAVVDLVEDTVVVAEAILPADHTGVAAIVVVAGVSHRIRELNP